MITDSSKKAKKKNCGLLKWKQRMVSLISRGLHALTNCRKQPSVENMLFNNPKMLSTSKPLDFADKQAGLPAHNADHRRVVLAIFDQAVQLVPSALQCFDPAKHHP